MKLFIERIFVILFKVSNNEVSEDLTQQVFIKAWSGISDFKFQKNPFSSWPIFYCSKHRY
jgi:DNA-directed RNA polymerase specialized sigma24 family protein